MTTARWICSTVAISVLSPTAQALDFELTPAVGYRFGGQFEDPVSQQSVDVEEAASFAVAFDVGYAPGQAIEVFYSRQNTEVRDTAPPFDLDIEYFQVGGVATFASESELQPYAVGTVGAARFRPGPGALDDETRFAATLGGGVKYAVSKNLGLRFEGRGYLTFFDTDAALFCVTDQGSATCRLRARSNVVWQLEAQAGITLRF